LVTLVTLSLIGLSDFKLHCLVFNGIAFCSFGVIEEAILSITLSIQSVAVVQLDFFFLLDGLAGQASMVVVVLCVILRHRQRLKLDQIVGSKLISRFLQLLLLEILFMSLQHFLVLLFTVSDDFMEIVFGMLLMMML
jgi:membrane-bound ClpP family serine protease